MEIDNCPSNMRYTLGLSCTLQQKMDLSKYSLALIKNDKIIFSSTHSGLRPLVELVKKGLKGDLLFDKVVGLAAAKLIVYGNVADAITTTTISKPASPHLPVRARL